MCLFWGFGPENCQSWWNISTKTNSVSTHLWTMNICGNYLKFRSPHQKQWTNFCGKPYEPTTLDSRASRNIPKSKNSNVSVVFFVLLGQLLISNWISLSPSSQLRVLFAQLAPFLAQAWCQHAVSLSTEKKYQNAPNTFKKVFQKKPIKTIY